MGSAAYLSDRTTLSGSTWRFALLCLVPRLRLWLVSLTYETHWVSAHCVTVSERAARQEAETEARGSACKAWREARWS